MVNPNPTITTMLGSLWCHTSLRRRRQFWLLLVLMIVAALAELFSIGAVVPFLGALTNPDRLYSLALAQPLIQKLGLADPSQLILPLTVVFVFATLLAGIVRVLLLWVTTRFSFAIGADIGINVYQRTLYQPYAVHVARNTSEVISGISTKANGVVYSVVLPFLQLLTALIILLVIISSFIALEPFITLLAFSGFGALYFSMIKLTKKSLYKNSQTVSHESTQTIKALQEGLGGIRDVLLDGSQATYCDIYRHADLRLRRAQGSSVFIGQSPRYVVEAVGMLFIAVLAYGLTKQGSSQGAVIGAGVLPVLGALALGAQRLLPILQQAYWSWASMRGAESSLQDVLALLNQPMPEYSDRATLPHLPFNKSLSLKGVGFKYSSESQYVLQGVNLDIAKGSCVGFMGPTGSGKSTLLDIVMGLLTPTEGTLEVDGCKITLANYRAWQSRIAHVPQAIFLCDASIAENIAFGVPKDKVDLNRVKSAAQKACIADTIESWPQQYETFVGERGVRLSGGQRQRIGIARALYKEADVIIFDEATSALDNETEAAVMHAIEALGQDHTLLIIAHRLSTLKNCSQIVELESGTVQTIDGSSNIKKILNT
jgi:ATP-binding cassette, subfamily B, bacterial PglK